MPTLRDMSMSNFSLKSLSRDKKDASTISLYDIGAPYNPQHLNGVPLSTLQNTTPIEANPDDSYGRISPKTLDAGGNSPSPTAVTGAEQPAATTYHELPADAPVPRTPRWQQRAQIRSGGVYTPRIGGGSTKHGPRGADPSYSPRDTAYTTPQRAHPKFELAQGAAGEQSNSALTGDREEAEGWWPYQGHYSLDLGPTTGQSPLGSNPPDPSDLTKEAAPVNTWQRKQEELDLVDSSPPEPVVRTKTLTLTTLATRTQAEPSDSTITGDRSNKESTGDAVATDTALESSPLESVTATTSAQYVQAELSNSTLTGARSVDGSIPQDNIAPNSASDIDPPALVTAPTLAQRAQEEGWDSTRTGTHSDNTSPRSGVATAGRTPNSDRRRQTKPLAQRRRVQREISFNTLNGAYSQDASPGHGIDTADTSSNGDPQGLDKPSSPAQRTQEWAEWLSKATLTSNHSNNTIGTYGIDTADATSNNDAQGSIKPFNPAQRAQAETSKTTLTGSDSNDTSPRVEFTTPTKKDRSHAALVKKGSRTQLTDDTPRSATPSTKGVPPLPVPPEKWANDENYNRTLIAPRSNDTLTDITSTPTRSGRRQRSRRNLMVSTPNGKPEEVNVATPGNNSNTDVRVAEGGFIKRKPVAPGASPTVPQKNAARYVRTPAGNRAAHTIVGQAGPRDRVAAAPPLPATWDTTYDRALCIMDVRGYSYEAMISELRRGLGEKPTLTPAMIDQRLRQLR